MQLAGRIRHFSTPVRYFLVAYIIALTFGYCISFVFLEDTTNLQPAGIQQNYLGNQDQQKQEKAKKMKFKMTEREILTTIHTHTLSISFVFVSLGAILLCASLPTGLQKFLLTEPFLSIILTFGGIWVMWKGIEWFKYVVMISGILMHGSFLVIVGVLLWQLLFLNNSRPQTKRPL